MPLDTDVINVSNVFKRPKDHGKSSPSESDLL